MRLFRHGEAGRETPGVALPDGTLLDASAVTRDYGEEFFAGGGLARLRDWLAGGAPGGRPVTPPFRFGPPIARPSKIVCVGLNYRAHAEETGAPIPSEPVLFMKATTAMCGPFDDLVLPRGGTHTDYEVELAVVLGSRAASVDETEAAGCIAGYTLMCDYSERDFQKNRGGQWVKGKSADTFAPLGPWLVTPDEAGPPGAHRLWLKVNGETRQDGRTSDLIFGVPFLVSYISRFMTLLPGDVISTGTPSGVGMGYDPPRFLREGDRVELGIDGLCEAAQAVTNPHGTR